MTDTQRTALVEASTPENVERLVLALLVCRQELRYANANHTLNGTQAKNTPEAIALAGADAALAPFKGVKP